MMTSDIYFEIAEHLLLVKVPSGFPLMSHLPSFTDFLIDGSRSALSPVLEVNVSLDSCIESDIETRVLADSSPVWGDGFSFEESTNFYHTKMKLSNDSNQVIMLSNKDFSQSTIYLSGNDESFNPIIGWFLMVAFGQSVLLYKTILIHASTVERNIEEAYAFLGKSGTGKSTHSQLWLRNLEGFTLLNDDNPAIRILDDNEVYIYGTPWSGKTSCYRNLKVKLKGLVRLSQSKINSFTIKRNSESMIMVLPSCTAIRWNMDLFNKMVDTVQEMINIIPVGYMKCLIDAEAAIMSYNGIKYNKL